MKGLITTKGIDEHGSIYFGIGAIKKVHRSVIVEQATVVLDYDARGRLVGIEVLGLGTNVGAGHTAVTNYTTEYRPRQGESTMTGAG